MPKILKIRKCKDIKRLVNRWLGGRGLIVIGFSGESINFTEKP
jgi:hypothetical protein